MKAICVFVLTIGVCLAVEKAPQDPGHPSNSPIPKAPPVQGKAGVQNLKEREKEVPINHSIAEIAGKTTANLESTSVPTPTKPAPPQPIYGIGKWNVTDDKGKSCILLSGEIALNLVNETDNKIFETVKVPSNAPSHGNCKEQCIEFDLPNNASLHLMFNKNATTSKFYLHAIKAKFSYVVENRTVNETFYNDTLHLFENPLDQSYFCARASENLVGQKPLLRINLKVDNFQVQAFKTSTTTDFDTAVDCEASHTPDIVPIIVGCSLGVLVILVLVAYLISRRRSQARGYLSM